MINPFRKKSKLAFESLPADEAMNLLIGITSDIEAIVKDERLRPILTKQAVPQNASPVDVANLVVEKGAEKLTELVRYFLQSKRENVYNILAALTVSNRAEYPQKPFKEVLSDIKMIMKNSEIIGFFTSAAK